MTETIDRSARARSGTRRVQTFCFHGIDAPGRALEPGEERFWITRDAYLRFLDLIVEAPREIDITFDDGNASDADIGAPALTERGLTAQFFVITDRIDAPGSLSSAAIREMAAAGMRFGTHGASHRPWPSLARSGELQEELARSTRILEELTSAPVTDAALPQGLYDRASLRAAKRHGFDRVYSVDEGWSRPSAWLRTRYTLISDDTVESVQALIANPTATADPWPARAVKGLVKRWR